MVESPDFLTQIKEINISLRNIAGNLARISLSLESIDKKNGVGINGRRQ